MLPLLRFGKIRTLACPATGPTMPFVVAVAGSIGSAHSVGWVSPTGWGIAAIRR